MNPHPRSGLLNGAPFASLFLILAVTVSQVFAGSTGFQVDIAVPSGGTTCGDGEALRFVRVLADGGIELNGEAVELARLPGRVREAFKDRAENVIFILADKNAAFGQVSAVIETARPQVAHIALLSHVAQLNPGACGPSLPSPAASRPPLHGFDAIRYWPL